MFEIILYDIANLLSFGPVCAGAGLVLLLVWYLYIRKTRREFHQGTAVGVFLLGIYLCLILEVSILSRESGSHAQEIDWNLFHVASEWAAVRACVIENIIMFIPLGILLPSVFYTFRKAHMMILSGLFLSIAIEVTQYCTGRGYCQLEDVIMNTIGTVIGFVIYRGYLKIYQIIEQ